MIRVRRSRVRLNPYADRANPTQQLRAVRRGAPGPALGPVQRKLPRSVAIAENLDQPEDVPALSQRTSARPAPSGYTDVRAPRMPGHSSVQSTRELPVIEMLGGNRAYSGGTQDPLNLVRLRAMHDVGFEFQQA